MADRAIGDLPQASQVTSNDLLLLQQGGQAKSITGNALTQQLIAAIDGHGGIVSITWVDSGESGNGATHTGTILMADGTTTTITIRDGLRGNTGDTWRVWIKYAHQRPTSNADMGDNPDDWIGISTSTTAPTSFAQYTWYKIKGEPGPGASVASTTVQYQASTSGTTPTGVWQDTVPNVPAGQYLWVHNSITFDSGDTTDWFEVSYQGRNGVDGTGAVATVNSVSPDAENHNVSLTASDIPYGNDTVANALDSAAAGIASKQSAVSGTGMLKNTGTGVAAIATKGIDYAATSFTVSLTSWSSNACTVNDNRFLADGYAYIVSPNSASRPAYISSGVYADDVDTIGSMTFHCNSAPSATLTVNICRVVSA